MFYCTIYQKYRAKDTWGVVHSLSYASESDAKRYAAALAKQASGYGAQVNELDNAYTITGQTGFNIYGFGRGANKIYSMISIEDESSKFSMSPGTSAYDGYTTDGFTFEERSAEYSSRLAANRAKEKEKRDYNLSRFEAEIKEENDLTKILTSLLKYAGQKIDKQKLIALAVKKIQGEPVAKEESNWYDELSDINN